MYVLELGSIRCETWEKESNKDSIKSFLLWVTKHEVVVVPLVEMGKNGGWK